MHNAIVQQPLPTVSPNSNPIIVMKRESSVNKCRSIPLPTSPVHCTNSGANACGFQSRVKRSNGSLADIPLCCKQCRRNTGNSTEEEGDIEDVSSELGNWVKGCTSWMKRPELYCSRRVRM
ncbi:hypothetical protein TNCV_233651 [Trichonephila clavipes]|nr:hypothetical protein TNCV_233651 [Trichonephila clavipes]